MVTYLRPPTDGHPGADGPLASDGHPPAEAPSQPRSVGEVLDAVTSQRPANGEWSRPVATGFELLDRVLEGGMHAGDLMMLGGCPGVGKTIAALQMARHAAMTGRQTVYINYEHDSATMLGRLLAMELGELARPDTAPEIDRLRSLVVQATSGYRSLEDLVRDEPLVAEAHQRVRNFADRLWLVRGSGAQTDIAAIEATLPDGGLEPLLIVDYLQKIPVQPEPATEAEKVTRSVEALKDLALRRRVAVIALVAADWDGVRSGRVRLHHLRGSSALAYECDIAVMLNEKHQAVSRTHLTFDSVKAESFQHLVVFSIEKNRSGPAMVDLEFRKDFMHYRFVPTGGYLMERLVDDRLAEESAIGR